MSKLSHIPLYSWVRSSWEEFNELREQTPFVDTDKLVWDYIRGKFKREELELYHPGLFSELEKCNKKGLLLALGIYKIKRFLGK